MENKKIELIPDNQKVYFFTKIVRNNFYSTTSPYHRTYFKYKFTEMTELSKPDVEYQENEFDLQWVQNQLKTGFQWYYMRLFQLYIEEGCSLIKLSKRTSIPSNSCSRDIKKVRLELIKRRNKILNDVL
jgi:hypothetical protein